MSVYTHAAEELKSPTPPFADLFPNGLLSPPAGSALLSDQEVQAYTDFLDRFALNPSTAGESSLFGELEFPDFGAPPMNALDAPPDVFDATYSPHLRDYDDMLLFPPHGAPEYGTAPPPRPPMPTGPGQLTAEDRAELLRSYYRERSLAFGSDPRFRPTGFAAYEEEPGRRHTEAGPAGVGASEILHQMAATPRPDPGTPDSGSDDGRRAKRKRKPDEPAARTASPLERRRAPSNAPERETLTEAQKRANHISSEKKRRDMIKNGFNELCELVPVLRHPQHAVGEPGRKDTGEYRAGPAGGASTASNGPGFSKSTILGHVAEFFQELAWKKARLRELVAKLETETAV
ncbi:uncharacterized protein V1510DRAFT_216815 [Dipodascopsis tothii]|uniref:uncharacterized protein n=1 Tax=Dipodascopsis tothii TaxID=44089 RepID=UPI0034CFFE30